MQLSSPARTAEFSLSQQSFKHRLTVPECSLHLAADEQSLRACAQYPKTNFVFDAVPNLGSVDPVPRLRRKFVAMKPARERSSHLNVGEVVIPFEFCNSGNPSPTEGKWRRQKE
jgi:hypothetical protein